MSALQKTITFLQGLMPCPVYFTLQKKAAKAILRDVVTAEGQSFLLRVQIDFGGESYDNPCRAGKAMHLYLCDMYEFQNTAPKTFDGWNKLKVCIKGDIYRLETLLPSEARKGNIAITELPPPGKDKRKHDLQAILAAGGSSIDEPVSFGGVSGGRPRLVNKRAKVVGKKTKKTTPIVCLSMDDIYPHMTTLAHHIKCTDQQSILSAIRRLEPDILQQITGCNIIGVASKA